MLKQGYLNPAWATEHLDNYWFPLSRKECKNRTEDVIVNSIVRILGILVSVPSKCKYKEEGGREGKNRDWQRDKEEEKGDDHLHYFFTSLLYIEKLKHQLILGIS